MTVPGAIAELPSRQTAADAGRSQVPRGFRPARPLDVTSVGGRHRHPVHSRREAPPMRDDPSVTDLVTSARSGDQQAWDALVERYAPLVWSICAQYRLS